MSSLFRQNIFAKVPGSFPFGGATPELLNLAEYNLSSSVFGSDASPPQHPKAVAASCSQLDLNRIQGVTKLGQLFKVAERGARLSPEGIAGLNFPFFHLGDPKPPFMEIVVHSCTEAGICRSKIFDAIEQDDPALEAIAKRGVSCLTGLRVNNLENIDEVPFVDRIHARTRALKILGNSPDIQGLVAKGELIVAEAYYCATAGKVKWLAFWTSNSLGKEITVEKFRLISEGRIKEKDLDGAHPGLKSLAALVLGNDTFSSNFEMAVPTEVVIFGCADSRLSSLIMKTPHGLVEWMHNAGNVVDSRLLLSLRVALEAAVRNIDTGFLQNGAKLGDPVGFKRRAVCLVMSHSMCGAAAATIEGMHARCGGHHAAHADKSALPIVNALSHRFEHYIADHAHPTQSDPTFMAAAEANALGACHDIMIAPGENAELIRRMVHNNQVLLVPAYYLLNSGRVNYLPPVYEAGLQRPGRREFLPRSEKIRSYA